MLDFLKELFSDKYMPHGHCYYWEAGLVWLHVISDFLIGAAYVSISLTLWYLIRKVRLPFRLAFLAFGVFIGACGGTHFMEVWNVWYAHYWIAGLVKVITATASVATAAWLFPLLPEVTSLVKTAELSEDRRVRLEKANNELENLYRKLKELDDLKSQFFANVSHELRTPLTLILGPVKRLLSAGWLTREIQYELEVIERNTRTLLKHVNDLLDISRLEAGKMPVKYTGIDLAELLRLTASHFDALAQERQLTFSVETDEPVQAECDPEKIQRVLLNLLSNAFKFTHIGGKVRCALRREADRAIITVQDNGPGVNPELREAIFERFRQGDGAGTRRFGGTGLGLAIAREFVGLHGGTIGVSDTPGGGATFTIELPLTTPTVVATSEGSIDRQQERSEFTETDELARQALDELRTLRNETEEKQDRDKDEQEKSPNVPAAQKIAPPDAPLLLVVEDNREMNRFIVESLSADYRIETAFNGREGLEKAFSLRPDLILSDVMMPEMSGDQMVSQLRAHKELENIPIILLTARADNEGRIEMLRGGAQDYVMKPFSVEEVQARVENLIKMKQARDLLQQDLSSQSRDLAELAKEATARKRELEANKKELETSVRLKDEFLATVSHELRTPLTSMLGWVRLLRTDDVDKPTFDRAMETIERNTRAQAQLIEDLLDMNRIITGKLHLEKQVLEMTRIIEEAVESVRLAADAKKIDMQMVLNPGAGPIVGDSNRLRQILYNLLSNAIKFTDIGGSVKIILERAKSHVEIKVSDTGKGINADFLPHIWEKFRQQDSSITRSNRGLGLGLAIVKSLVEHHGGEVEASSDGPGKGATFTVKLPLLGVRIDQESYKPNYRPTGLNYPKNLEGLKILIVEDDTDTLMILTVMLEQCKAEVKTAISFDEALETLQEWRPDILLSDIGLPGKTGYDLIRAVRELGPEQGGNIPAGALTAYAKEEDRQLALSSGYNIHVSKPVEPDELLATVAQLAMLVKK